MALTKRLVKGSALTFAEGDANWDHVLDRANHTGTDGAHTAQASGAVVQTLNRTGSAGKIQELQYTGTAIVEASNTGWKVHVPIEADSEYTVKIGSVETFRLDANDALFNKTISDLDAAGAEIRTTGSSRGRIVSVTADALNHVINRRLYAAGTVNLIEFRINDTVIGHIQYDGSKLVLSTGDWDTKGQ